MLRDKPDHRLLILTVIILAIPSFHLKAQEPWHPLGIDVEALTGKHICKPTDNSVVYEAKDVEPVTLISHEELPPPAIPFEGHVIYELIISETGQPLCASVLYAQNYPLKVIYSDIQHLMKSCFSPPRTPDGKQVRCYCYLAHGYLFGSDICEIVRPHTVHDCA